METNKMEDEASKNSAVLSSSMDEEYKEKLEKHRMILVDQRKRYGREYVKLANRFERALIEHKLAADYYCFRAFYFNFLPLTIIACAVTIIGFFIHGNVNTPSADGGEGGDGDGALQLQQTTTQFEPLLAGDSAKFWSIVVGILGAISTLITTIGKHTNYQSQFNMHQSAIKALEKICLRVDFEMDWFHRKAKSPGFIDNAVEKRLNTPKGVMYDDLSIMMGADLKSHQAGFEAMQNACSDSPVPTRVIQAFAVLDQTHDDGLCMDKDLMFYYHKLWKEFSVYPGWPLAMPKIDMIKKYREWKRELEEEEAEAEKSISSAYGAVDKRLSKIPSSI